MLLTFLFRISFFIETFADGIWLNFLFTFLALGFGAVFGTSPRWSTSCQCASLPLSITARFRLRAQAQDLASRFETTEFAHQWDRRAQTGRFRLGPCPVRPFTHFLKWSCHFVVPTTWSPLGIDPLFIATRWQSKIEFNWNFEFYFYFYLILQIFGELVVFLSNYWRDARHFRELKMPQINWKGFSRSLVLQQRLHGRVSLVCHFTSRRDSLSTALSDWATRSLVSTILDMLKIWLPSCSSFSPVVD